MLVAGEVPTNTRLRFVPPEFADVQRVIAKGRARHESLPHGCEPTTTPFASKARGRALHTRDVRN